MVALPLLLFAAEAARWMALGVEHAGRGDYQGAVEPFHRACLLDPKLPDACLYFGRTLYLLDRFDDAVNVLRTVAAKEPQNPEVFRIEALALEGAGKTADAEATFRAAIAIDKATPPNEDPRIDYGVFLYRQGRTEAALVPLESAIGRHPDSSRAHLELGCALLQVDRVKEATAHLEKALALDPKNARAQLLLGKAKSR